MTDRSVEAFPALEKIKDFDIIYSAGEKGVASIGAGLILEDSSRRSSIRATQGCAACPYHADTYEKGVAVGPLQVACSGFEEGIIAALRIIPKRGKSIPRSAALRSIPGVAPAPCGVDVLDIVGTAHQHHTAQSHNE